MFAAVCGHETGVSVFCGDNAENVRARLCSALLMGQDQYTFGTAEVGFLEQVDKIIEESGDPYWPIADLIEPAQVDMKAVEVRSADW